MVINENEEIVFNRSIGKGLNILGVMDLGIMH
jgi:hypothetical protein